MHTEFCPDTRNQAKLKGAQDIVRVCLYVWDSLLFVLFAVVVVYLEVVVVTAIISVTFGRIVYVCRW